MEGKGRGAIGDGQETHTPEVSPIAHSLVPLACAAASLVLLFAAALQMDRPAIEWVRSLQGLWIERIGDVGYAIGSGVSLIVISGLFVAIGYARANPVWRQA